MLLKQGWEEGKGLRHGAKGRADPYVPTQQYGGHLGLGCKRYKAILTGKGAEDEIRVCAPAALIMCPLLFCLSVSKHVCLFLAILYVHARVLSICLSSPVFRSDLLVKFSA